MKARRNILFTIGIDSYQSNVWRDLSNAMLDCKEILKILSEKYSFEEYLPSLFNEKATKENIINSFNTLRNFTEPDDNLLIFYAGHGNMNPQTGRGYWIPYEGTSDSHTWIENSVIKDFIEDFNVQHIWLIVDSCFSGTFLSKTRGRSIKNSYETLDHRKSRWMLASGREEKVSDGIPGQHSPFCRYLFRYLNHNSNRFTSVSEIIKYVHILTTRNSGQSPMGATIENIGHEGGEMILTLNGNQVYEVKISYGRTNTPELRLEQANNNTDEKKLAAGKEILIVKSFVEGFDLLVIENSRFNDAGNKTLKFKESEVILQSRDKEERLTLIRRFATWQGLTRYIDLNDNYFKSIKVGTVSAHEDIENVEQGFHALAHSDHMRDLLDFNKDLMTCLHCEEKISTNDSYLVEIDELELEENVGSVHKECLRPADRILGRSGYEDLPPSNLVNFNYTLWADLLQKGQGQLKGLGGKIGDRNKVAIISWNPAHNRNKGTYCIRIHYDNGDSFFMSLGKDIHRFKKEDIDNELAFFNEQLNSRITQEDPPVMIVETKMFGFFKHLSKLKSENQTLAKVTSYEKVLYSKQFEQNKSDIENDYTPIGLVKDVLTDEIICIGNIIPLLSRPEDFELFHENWKIAIKDLKECTINVISSDFELDSYLQSFFLDGYQPIIDPILNHENKELESGYIVKSFQQLIQEAERKGKWKEGDQVKVVFPGVETDKFATGVLLTDEFIDETGEPCAIFQVIENGERQEHLTFKMPIKLFQKTVQ